MGNEAADVLSERHAHRCRAFARPLMRLIVEGDLRSHHHDGAIIRAEALAVVTAPDLTTSWAR